MAISLTCLLALSVGRPAAGPQEYRVRWQPRHFADCADAAQYVAVRPAVGRYRYGLRARLAAITVRHYRALGYRGGAKIAYSLDAASSAIDLPRWSWPRMTPAETAALADFVSALRNHELGQRDIAERALVRSSTVTVIAPSAESAKRELLRALRMQLAVQRAELQQSENTYERVTGYGARQSEGTAYGFRGGMDVAFRCP